MPLRSVRSHAFATLRLATLLLMVCCGLASCGDDRGGGGGGGNGTTPASTSCTAPDCDAKIAAVVAATNQARSQQQDCGQYGTKGQTAALASDAALNEAAQAHANDMAANDFFSHTGSDNSQFFERIEHAGYLGQPVGENIAAGQATASEVVDGWIRSDGHCRNIMNPSATKIGVGFAEGGPYGTLWVQVFAR